MRRRNAYFKSKHALLRISLTFNDFENLAADKMIWLISVNDEILRDKASFWDILLLLKLPFCFDIIWKPNTLRDNDVVITSKRRHFDVITSKWRRFDVITNLCARWFVIILWPKYGVVITTWLEQKCVTLVISNQLTFQAIITSLLRRQNKLTIPLPYHTPSVLHALGALQWRHNGRDGHDGVSNHQPHDCLFRRRSKKTSELRVTGLCVGNSPVSGEFPAQIASNAENVSMWWRHHEFVAFCAIVTFWLALSRTFTVIHEHYWLNLNLAKNRKLHTHSRTYSLNFYNFRYSRKLHQNDLFVSMWLQWW